MTQEAKQINDYTFVKELDTEGIGLLTELFKRDLTYTQICDLLKDSTTYKDDPNPLLEQLESYGAISKKGSVYGITDHGRYAVKLADILGITPGAIEEANYIRNTLVKVKGIDRQIPPHVTTRLVDRKDPFGTKSWHDQMMEVAHRHRRRRRRRRRV